MLKILLTYIFILSSFQLIFCQNKQGTLQFMPIMGDSILDMDRSYEIDSSNNFIIITKFKFYISQLKFYNKESEILSQESNHYLYDHADPKAITFEYDSTEEINKIKYVIGVDSTLSYKGAQDGVLDPVEGMYWTWQNGYIYLKIEGKSSICNSRNNEFNLHIGGYLKPNNAIRELETHIEPENQLILAIDIMKFLNKINLRNNHTIMQPNPKSGQIIETLEDVIFQINEY